MPEGVLITAAIVRFVFPEQKQENQNEKQDITAVLIAGAQHTVGTTRHIFHLLGGVFH